MDTQPLESRNEMFNGDAYSIYRMIHMVQRHGDYIEHGSILIMLKVYTNICSIPILHLKYLESIIMYNSENFNYHVKRHYYQDNVIFLFLFARISKLID